MSLVLQDRQKVLRKLTLFALDYQNLSVDVSPVATHLKNIRGSALPSVGFKST